LIESQHSFEWNVQHLYLNYVVVDVPILLVITNTLSIKWKLKNIKTYCVSIFQQQTEYISFLFLMLTGYNLTESISAQFSVYVYPYN